MTGECGVKSGSQTILFIMAADPHRDGALHE
jgi:hypothetical protein